MANQRLRTLGLLHLPRKDVALLIRVAIFEDNASLRASLAELVNGAEDLRLAGAFASCRSVLDDVADCRPHVVLMDIGLPGVSGIEAVRRVTERFPEVQAIMLTVYEDEQRVFESICGGAAGYLLKKTPASGILDAIRSVRAGGVPMTPSVARRVLGLLRANAPAAPPRDECRLSEREREILVGLTAGQTYQKIADSLFISLDTVRSHVRHVYEKLRVHSKSEAVAKAIRQKLV